MTNKFQSIYEAFIDGVKTSGGYHSDIYVEIFKNPSPRELKQCGKACRGILLKGGDFYVAPSFESTDEGRVIIHSDLLSALRDLKIITGSDRHFWDFRDRDIEGIDMQRDEYTNEFWIGESVYGNVENKDKVQQIFDKAAKKNPSIKFINQKITGKYTK